MNIELLIGIHMLAFVSGFLLDCLFADPYWMPHPVRFMGYLISFIDIRLMGKKKDASENKKAKDNDCDDKDVADVHKKEFYKGVLLVICVVAATAIVTFTILAAAYLISPVCGFVAETFMTYQILAARCLQKESHKVYKALKKIDINKARYAVSMIVGRDTDVLDEEGIARAAIETVAESTSDGVIAPMIYTAFGTVVFGMIYKAINTMDSMVGYKSSRYMYFGRAAAKLDDFANLLPSRISALFMIAASLILRYDAKWAWHIWRRDSRKHASPNAGQTESACAGALNIRLAGDTVYGKKVVQKPYIGDDIKNITPEDICRSNRLMYVTAAICELVCIVLMACVLIIVH